MKILAVTGASGGHIYPALAFMEKVKGSLDGADRLLVLPSRSIKFDLSSFDCRIARISSARLSFRLSPKSLMAFMIFIKGAWESLILLLKFRPDVVVGFGSIDSIPLVIWGWFFRIRTIIHEQNVLPGRANIFLSKFVDKIAVSFPESGKYFSVSQDKIFLTGNPIREGIKKTARDKALSLLGFDRVSPVILVMGGSQGSGRINSVFMDMLDLIKEKGSLQVIHITGSQDYSIALKRYQGLGIKSRVYGFLEDMGLAYSAADLAITRAGATTLAELAYFRLPAIIIPYPFAYSHQDLNAEILNKTKAAFVIKEDLLSPENLKKMLEDLVSNPGKIEKMREGFSGNYCPDGAALLADLALNLK